MSYYYSLTLSTTNFCDLLTVFAGILEQCVLFSSFVSGLHAPVAMSAVTFDYEMTDSSSDGR